MPSQAYPRQSALYRSLACCYDPLFKLPLSGRIHQVIRSLEIPPGARILDVGVGTGNYLAAYPRHAQVVGIDLSDDMLAYAQRSVEQQGWCHVALRHMDALDLDFAANTFDFVTGFHAASVVGAPGRMLSEMVRVCKPGGTVVIVNHFRTEQRWLAPLVSVAAPLTRWLGWDSNVAYDEMFIGSVMQVEKRYKTSPLSPFTVVVGRKPATRATCSEHHRG